MKTRFSEDEEDWFESRWKRIDLFHIMVTPLETGEDPSAHMGPWKIKVKERYTDYPPYYGYGGLITFYSNSTFDWMWLLIPLTPLEDVKLEARCHGGRIEFPHLHFDDYSGLWKTLPAEDTGYHYIFHTGQDQNG